MTTETHIAVTWRSRFVQWSDIWPDKGFMVFGRRRSSFRLLRAAMGLVDEAGADGRLHGKNDWWTEKHLAERMHLSQKTAREIFRWLEETGWLQSKAQPITREGTRQPDMRWLTIPQGQPAISRLPKAPAVRTRGSSGNATREPAVKIPGSSGNGRIQPLPQSVDTEIRRYVDPDVAKATENDPADTSQSINPYRRPVERWQEIKDKAVAR